MPKRSFLRPPEPVTRSQRGYYWDRGYEDGFARRSRSSMLKNYIDYGRGYDTGLRDACVRDDQVRLEQEIELKADELRPVLERLGFTFNDEGKVSNAISQS